MSKNTESSGFKIQNPDAGRKLNQSEINFMQLIEKQNLERVTKLKKLRKNNILLGCTLGASVLGVYFYSIFSVKQETFLDDFEEPKKISIE